MTQLVTGTPAHGSVVSFDEITHLLAVLRPKRVIFCHPDRFEDIQRLVEDNRMSDCVAVKVYEHLDPKTAFIVAV